MRTTKMEIVIAALLSTTAVYGADLTPKAVPLKAPPPISTPWGLYVFAGGGMATAAQESVLTGNGFDVSTASGFNQLKAHPTGALVSAGLGVVAPTAIGRIGAEFDANFIFSRAEQDCLQGAACLGHSRNAFLLHPKVLYSPFPQPLAWTGWQWTKTLDVYATGGVPLRELSACLATGLTRTGDIVESCDTAWLYGPSAGVIIEFPIYDKASLRLVYDHNWYAGSVTKAGTGVFSDLQNNMKVLNEDVFKAQIKYTF